ncbi:MAG TPA: hypothetical protein VKS80_14340 [Trinickia sp.]|nr:hypothetical protein [Trinickia sp.]
MKLKVFLASIALAGSVASSVPAPVYADGAASTRNILLLGGAAAYMIIQHNRKVHQKYAEDAQREADLEQQNNDEHAAYEQERRAYNEQVAVTRELQKEVAYQHEVVEQQRAQLSALHVQSGFSAPGSQVAAVSYGWGNI